jgi:NH3-dependent NAD+ synthetase
MTDLISMPSSPRVIDAFKTFDAISEWIAQKAKEERAPGLIVGLSGTDSLLVYLACYKALDSLGKADRLLGVHFNAASEQEVTPHTHNGFACVQRDFNWVARDLFPWLDKVAPKAKLELDHSEGFDNDHVRWGRLFARAVSDTDHAHSLGDSHYFTVGTRNATEDYLGTYSQISKAVSMQPIVHLYKSEVLKICAALDVPQIALDKSREIDCDCGRFDTAANHLEEVDAYIMKRQKQLSGEFIKAMPRETQASVMEYVLEEEERNKFREQTPYRPSKSPIILKTS